MVGNLFSKILVIMKKIFILAFISVFGMATLTSCANSQNSTSSGGTVLGNIASSLIAILASLLQQTGNGTAAANLSMATKVNSVIKGDQMVSSFKNLLSSTYKIPMETVNKAYAGFSNLTSVATFIVENASPAILTGVK